MTHLEEIRQELAEAKREKEVSEHQIIRAQNRLNNALKKQDKQRTHRLIVEGAELEYVFEGIELLPQHIFWEFMHALVRVPGVMELFEKMKNGSKESGGEGGEA